MAKIRHNASAARCCDLQIGGRMRMLHRAILLLLATALLATSTNVAFAEGPTWRDSTRDVYVDGHLDRSARVLSADGGRKTAVLLPGARKALLLDREASTFSVVPRKAFAFNADGMGAEAGADTAPKRGGAIKKRNES